MDKEFVPRLKFSSISDIYPELSLSSQITRYKKLIDSFEKLYNRKPKFVARSPGRVNLIGEHIDYAGFGVLPMAISRDVLIAVDIIHEGEENDTKVRIANVLNEKYPPRNWEYEGKEKIVEIEVKEGISEWGNYSKSAYKGIVQHLSLDKPKGMYLLVDGNVPPGSGLSSSAAFICSVCIATCFSNDVILTKKEIVEISIEAERFIGMNAGGMDQTASMFSLKEHVLYIQFLPSLCAIPTKLPSINPPIAFVIANSLINSDKIVTAPINYNLRVVETKLAAHHLGQCLFNKPCENLKQVSDLYSNSTEVIVENLIKLSDYVEKIYENNHDGFTLDELSSLLNLNQDEIKEKFLNRFPVRAKKFQLYKRSKHVFEEASRVLKFYELCSKGEARESIFEGLGNLMNESHKSCKELFECSCDELDDLVKICLDGGAVGSRLTGAGWGGCTVSLIRENEIDKFINFVSEKYYNVRFSQLSHDDLENVIFATRPGGGAAIIENLFI
ncbi:17552_t:CDS:1 [Funneliformis geosporum]|uniref:Galactokinase n=1 Tax=Funneliformis geosporum TaxID=1117311 RepID=A0A9W4X2A0_9GLOM|nr:17552_t:CDS:1 [Funneliformis geosporum]CAI2181207.1 9059_t:CDS:1 [Funneliformis geosporum]